MAYEVIRGGQKYSTAKIQPGDIVTKKIVSSGGSGSSRSSSSPTVSVNGYSVVINGVGYSVPIEKQEEFIRQQTGGVGSSVQAAIEVARQNAIKQQQEQAALLKAAAVKKQQDFINKLRINDELTRANLLNKLKVKNRQSYSPLDSDQFAKRIAEEQNKLINKIQKQGIIDRINKLGALTDNRKSILEYKNLMKERDQIYSDLAKVSSKYPSELNPVDFARYQREIAPIIARYNVYTTKRNKVIDSLPNNYVAAEIEINPVTGEKVLVASAKDRSLSGRINESINKTMTKISRRGSSSPSNLKETAALSGLIAAGVGIEAVKSIAALPSTIKTIILKPSVIKEIPKAIKQEGRDFGTLIRISPTAAIVKVGANLVILKGTNKAIKDISRVSSRVLAELNPRFLGELKAGRLIQLKTGQNRISRLKVVGKIPTQKISRQISIAGREVKVAVSTQADSLLGFLRRSRTIRKPLGKEVENALGKKATSLLRKYDKGINLTSKEIKYLNNAIKKAGSKGLLERSFFASPGGEIRPSRLGLRKEKKLRLIDYLTDDITFRQPKPQILIFENLAVEKFPKSLKGIVNKLRRGKILNELEANMLLEFQLKRSGKFKPLGFVSGEKEITLPSGEILKRVKKVGVVRIKGKTIPIIKAEVFRPTGKLKKALSKYRAGKLTEKEIKLLDKKLQRQTGFNYGLSSYKSVKARYVSIKRLGASILSSKSKKINSPKKRLSRVVQPKKLISPRKSSGNSKINYTRSGRPFIITRSGARFISPSSVKSPQKIISIKRPLSSPRLSSSPSRPAKNVRVITRKNIKQDNFKTFSRPVKLFRIIVKKRGKAIVLNDRLTEKDALNFMAYELDTQLLRTARLLPTGSSKRARIISPKYNGAFENRKRKLRQYKISRKKKVAIRGFIEKRRFALDTPTEKAQLRRIQKRKKLTPAQKKIALKSLEKARKVRKMNLKKRSAKRRK